MKREQKFWGFLLLIGLALLILGLARSVQGAGSYGSAQFYRTDAWTVEELVEAWYPLDAGTMGDATEGKGNFESWAGTHSTCDDCPASGWVCSCTSDSEIRPETATVYRDSRSMEFEVDATGSDASAYYTFTFAANKAYQVSFCYKGETGAEDFKVQLVDSGATDYYNFTTDTWGAAHTWTFDDITVDWVCTRAYVVNAGAVKVDYRWTFIENGASQTWYIDNFQIQELLKIGVVGSRGNVLSVPPTSDPLWGRAEVTFPRVERAPPGKWGADFDSDWISRDDDDTFDPSANSYHMSIGCKIVKFDVTLIDSIITKHAVVGNWILYTTSGGDRYVFSWRDLSGTFDSVASADDVIFDNTLSSFVATYEFISDGTSESNIYVDHRTVVTDLTGEGPIRNISVGLTIGAYNNGTLPFLGRVLICAYWDKPLSAIEANKFISPYFPGTQYGNDGFYVTLCSQAASHATCSWSKCRDGTPESCQAEGTGTMAVFISYTEQVDNNSVETISSGGDVNPDWADWTELETAGNGSSVITAYRHDTYHGEVSARVKLTGTTSSGELRSECITTGMGVSLYSYAYTKKLSGVSEFTMRIEEFDNADCTSLLQTDTLVSGVDLLTSWEDFGGKVAAATWHVDTSSYQLVLTEEGDNGVDILVDMVSVKEASYYTPPVENKTGSGSTTYNTRDYRLHNVLTDYIDGEGGYPYSNGWCVSMWVYTDWPGDDGNGGDPHYIIYSPGTAGDNNRWGIAKDQVNRLRLYLYDSAGERKYVRLLGVDNTNWTAGSRKYIEACTDNSGTIAGHHYNEANDTWYDWSDAGGIGTGIQDGQSSELHVGHFSGTSTISGYFYSIEFVPYSATWPKAGFEPRPVVDPH